MIVLKWNWNLHMNNANNKHKKCDLLVVCMDLVWLIVYRGRHSMMNWNEGIDKHLVWTKPKMPSENLEHILSAQSHKQQYYPKSFPSEMRPCVSDVYRKMLQIISGILNSILIYRASGPSEHPHTSMEIYTDIFSFLFFYWFVSSWCKFLFILLFDSRILDSIRIVEFDLFLEGAWHFSWDDLHFTDYLISLKDEFLFLVL